VPFPTRGSDNLGQDRPLGARRHRDDAPSTLVASRLPSGEGLGMGRATMLDPAGETTAARALSTGIQSVWTCGGGSVTQLRSNIEWKQWGKEDPLWGVASLPSKQRGGESPWTNEEFYDHGNSNWQDFFAQWQHYGVNRGSCLEVGCGAGRITLQLAGVFDRVYAVDVSEDMIDYARTKIGMKNVDFSLIDGLHLPHPDRSVKAVFSTHVLQHLDDEGIGLAYFREFYRVLEPGGTMMVHMPLYQFPVSGAAGTMMRSIYKMYRWLGVLRADVRRRAGRKSMRRTPYQIEALGQHLTELGFTNVEFRIFPTKINWDLHPFIFATK
jgi:ubiquinone/menaquinone biosynthesis C-methylase UbiE